MKCLLCDAKAEWSIEIMGLNKLYLCERHSTLLGRAVKDEYWYGQEEVNG
jgi:hypothetical protein